MSKTRKQRSAAELIAEAQTQLANRVARAARKEALSNPTLAPLVADLEAAKKEVREAKKLTGDGPQSAQVRIEKHKAWCARIYTELSDAKETISSGEQRIAEIEAQLQLAVASLSVEG